MYPDNQARIARLACFLHSSWAILTYRLHATELTGLARFREPGYIARIAELKVHMKSFRQSGLEICRRHAQRHRRALFCKQST